MKKFGHPAVCPVEIPFRCIHTYTPVGATVLDPFGGSGTTLIAAEKAGRSALLCERQPCYCDATIARWEALSDARPRRRLGGKKASEKG
ncbi:MAG: site-specific DNA-methyltransferase [Candidatus Hydrogenedentes bacterium]|nr:site-specific DNA-methyltransferase [Candidatus Hydrogenedentota bacterium]